MRQTRTAAAPGAGERPSATGSRGPATGIDGATKPLAPGKATIRFDFAYDGGGPGKGGMGALFVNDEKVAEGRIEHTQAGMFSRARPPTWALTSERRWWRRSAPKRSRASLGEFRR